MKIRLVDGWHAEESDSLGTFRWMSGKAEIAWSDGPDKGLRFLKLIAGHTRPLRPRPVLKVESGGNHIGEAEIDAAESSYAFPLPEGTEGIIRFSLNSVIQAPGDGRELGIFVRRMEIVGPETSDPFLDGWFEPDEESEEKEKEPLRWMRPESAAVLECLPGTKEPVLFLEAGPLVGFDGKSKLAVRVGGKLLGRADVLRGISSYRFLVPHPEPFLHVEMSLENYPSPGENELRRLGLRVKRLFVEENPNRGFVFASGWYGEEQGEFFNFRWMSGKASLFLTDVEPGEDRFLSFYAFSEYCDQSQILSLSRDGTKGEDVPLLNRWNSYCLKIPGRPVGKEGEQTAEVRLSLNKLFPPAYHPGDDRELGVRIGNIRVHTDAEERVAFERFHGNALKNFREMMEGKSDLESFPINLGIDLYSKCNIKPPCVYCLWDSAKVMEGDYVKAVVDETTLASYGSFFDAARTLVNCSFGEPLLHPRLPEILDLCAANNKILELATNGQAFTKRTISALAGKPVYLYVSLDAARKETYAKIRNDNWDGIVKNLVRLNEERQKKGGLPKLYMVFMPMRVNRDDLEEYFRLCKRIEADALVLRPLLFLNEPKIRKSRGGYDFNYKDELLPREEAKVLIAEAERLSKIYGISLANQFDFGLRKKIGGEKTEELGASKF
ncbi:MAG: radical SAM protein [Candidatus Aminicenantes bacterium]|nr:radical SAM protein [Candidatus Aminicenantes bacterium]